MLSMHYATKPFDIINDAVATRYKTILKNRSPAPGISAEAGELSARSRQ